PRRRVLLRRPAGARAATPGAGHQLRPDGPGGERAAVRYDDRRARGGVRERRAPPPRRTGRARRAVRARRALTAVIPGTVSGRHMSRVLDAGHVPGGVRGEDPARRVWKTRSTVLSSHGPSPGLGGTARSALEREHVADALD